MILHTERKFEPLIETFVANQINMLNDLSTTVFTVKANTNFEINANVYSSEDTSILSTKFLTKYSLTFFEDIIKQKSLSPSLIHCHFLTDAIFFHPFTKKYYCPKVCSCYGYDVSEFPHKFGIIGRMYLRKAFREYDVFFAMSEDMRKDLIAIGCPPEKIQIHYHGINTQNFAIDRIYLKNKHHLNLLTVGRLDPKKGHLAVLKIIKMLKDTHPNYSLKYTIVGDGTSKSILEKYIFKNKLEHIVEFKGFIRHGPELKKILQDADIFIHLSTTTKTGDKEGIPGTIVEAMASGLPVISTYHAGIPSVIQNNLTGFLFNETDLEGVLNKIIDLHDYKLREYIGRNAQSYAKNHLDVSTKTRDLTNIYTELINSHKKKP